MMHHCFSQARIVERLACSVELSFSTTKRRGENQHIINTSTLYRRYNLSTSPFFSSLRLSSFGVSLQLYLARDDLKPQ